MFTNKIKKIPVYAYRWEQIIIEIDYVSQIDVFLKESFKVNLHEYISNPNTTQYMTR